MENNQLTETIEKLRQEVELLQKQAEALKTGFNLLSARSDLVDWVLQDMVAMHPRRKELAAQLRESVAEQVDALAEDPNPEYESFLTLTLAAVLEAAGEPPPR